MGRPRILLADDHTLVVEGFRKLLEPDFDIIGVVSDGQALLSLALQEKPDVTILDIGMPLLSGIEAGRELKKRLPRMKLIVLTMNEDPDIAREALRQWASAYLVKKCAGSELTTAVREVLKGKSYVTPRLAQKIMDEFVRDPRIGRTKELTPRQREVLHLLAEGRTMKEVAGILNISPRTAEFHKARIQEALGLETTAELIAMPESLASREAGAGRTATMSAWPRTKPPLSTRMT
jgi:DNA-binding NarL/FixJ family response regulator